MRWSVSRAFVPLAGAACVLTACGGSGSGPMAAGKPLHAPANFDPTLPGWIACSRVIVEGDVLRVRDARTPGRMVTDLTVDDWIKPGGGPRTAHIETGDIAAEGVYRRWSAGTHLVLQADVDPTALPGWHFDRRMVERIKHAVPGSRGLDCPYGPA